MSHSTKAQVDLPSVLTRLSPSVYLYDPNKTLMSEDFPERYFNTQNNKVSNKTIRSSPSAAPKVIVLFTWMSANMVHILKYLPTYQSLYPNSRLLVVRSSPADIIWRSGTTQRRRLAPAVSAVISHCTAYPDSEPEILLHLFSNGGSSQLLPFLDAYREQTSQSVPPHVKIFDSCPGRGTFKEGIHALSVPFPKSQPMRIISFCILYLAMGIYFFILTLFGITNPIERIRQALNDPKYWGNERGRCYIYGDADKMVRSCDVEAHAEDARQKGLAVRLEKFEASGHVAHVRQGGGGRYWKIVEDTWQRR